MVSHAGLQTRSHRSAGLYVERFFMKISCALILTAGLFLAADEPAKDAAPGGDLAKLQGTWLTVSLVNDGKTLVGENVPPKPGPITKVAYEGNKWMVKVEDKTVASGIIKIDSTRMPKELDVLDESGTKNGKTKLAIYELDGDTFRYCIAQAGKPRPTEFEGNAGSGHSLIVSKREKP